LAPRFSRAQCPVQFIAKVQKVEASHDVQEYSARAGLTTPDAQASPASPPAQKYRLMRWSILVLSIAAVSWLAVGFARHAFFQPAGNAVAVLPLRSLSADADQQHFADAMTDLLLTDLGRIGKLKVVSRQSVLQYEGTHKTMPEIARELNVDYIVEGTVLRAGQQVRITAQLIHGPTDHHVWAQSYDRDLGDTFALQEDVAEAIAREVGVKIAPVRVRERAQHVGPAVYETYLRGVYFLDEGNIDDALKELKNAVAADPNYAPAYTKIASAYFGHAFFGAMPPKEAFPNMKEAALRAIELDEGNAEAHAWLAIEKLQYEWDWAGAEREFKRSLELNPSDADVRHMYAHYLLTVGRWQESLSQMDRAFENDPVGVDAAT
jgi:TolB-like protein